MSLIFCVLLEPVALLKADVTANAACIIVPCKPTTATRKNVIIMTNFLSLGICFVMLLK